MKIAVTGSAGFVGYNLSKSLLIGGHEVIGIDNLTENYKNYDYISAKKHRNQFLKEFPNYKFYKLDVTKDELPNNLKSADHTVHLAAKDFYYEDEEQRYSEYIEHNVVGTSRVFEWSRRLKVKKFIFASTHSVYGNARKEVFTEKKIVPKPISPHGASKLSAEHAVKFLSKTYDIPSLILRISTIYGPDALQHQIIPQLIFHIFKGDQFVLHVSPDTKRDFVYIDDVVRAIESCFSKRLTLQTINIGSGKSHTIKEVAEEIAKIANKDIKKIKFEKSKDKKHIDNVTTDEVKLSIARAKKMLNYKPETSLQEGLKQMVDWYFENGVLKK